MLPFPVVSVATPPFMFTETAPSIVGVTINVYVVPLPAKVPAVPLVTDISPKVKSDTVLLNVAVTFMLPLVEFGVAEVKVTVGGVVSISNVLLVGALDELPAASVVAESDTVAMPSL